MREHIGRLDPDTTDASELQHFEVRVILRGLLESFLLYAFDLFDLSFDETEVRHVALQFG